ncbi:hypothetical protein ACPYO6_14550 [Georgenia sp. Z1344]|uniref:hypothetical protein n=1 Tax=Georgenia sp. Z1344 TaxID=3416706 RepID=UPI003CED218C
MHPILFLLTWLGDRLRDDDPERGDVPGWVMVTLMTAGLVIIIWAIAETQLGELFQTAIDRVLGGGS